MSGMNRMGRGEGWDLSLPIFLKWSGGIGNCIKGIGKMEDGKEPMRAPASLYYLMKKLLLQHGHLRCL